MDVLRSHYLGRVRLLSDSGGKTWIRWYPALPGALAFPHLHCTGSHVWRGHFDDHFKGPGEFAHPQPWRPKRFPARPGQEFHGPAEWFHTGIPAAQLGQGDANAECLVSVMEGSGGAVAGGAAITFVRGEWWSELIERDESVPIYAHRQVEKDSGGAWVVVAGGPSGTVASQGAWEVSDRLAIPVPLTYVRMRYGTSERPFLFQHDDLEPIIRLVDTSPSITLPAGRAFIATLAVADLTGAVPDQTVTGSFGGSVEIYALDLADADELPAGELHQGRLVGRHADHDVWAFRSDVDPPPDIPPGGTVAVSIPGTDPTTYTHSTPGILDITYCIRTEGDGAVVCYEWLCFSGVCGWFNRCSCVWEPYQFYCTPEGCIALTAPPADVVSGPYDFEVDCAAACAALAWWCVESAGPTFTCTAALSEPAGSVSGPYATEAECAAVCGQPWWCIDSTPPAPWWCVATPAPPSSGTGACDPCTSGAPRTWLLPVAGIDVPYFASLGGDWSMDLDPASRDGSCLWDTSPIISPTYPRWSVILSDPSVPLLRGQMTDGTVVTFALSSSLDCCGPNTFTFARASGARGVPRTWNEPATLTITPGSGCDPVTPSTTACVQAFVAPAGMVSGPYDTVELCEAACGGGGGGVITSCCPDNPVSTALVATITDGGILDGTLDTTSSGGATWTATTTDDWGSCSSGGLTVDRLVLTCSAGVWNLGVNAPMAAGYTATSTTCDPFAVTFGPVDLSGCGGGAAATITITPAMMMMAAAGPRSTGPDPVSCVQSATSPPTALAGPFASEADCLAGCPPITPGVPCGDCSGDTPLTWTVVIAGFSGPDPCCSTTNGTWEVTQSGLDPCVWQESDPNGPRISPESGENQGISFGACDDACNLTCPMSSCCEELTAWVISDCGSGCTGGTITATPHCPVGHAPLAGTPFPSTILVAPAIATSSAASPATATSSSASPATATRSDARRAPCVHRGDYTGHTVPCGPAKKCRQKLYACELYDQCTIGVRSMGYACCKTCESYDPRPRG